MFKLEDLPYAYDALEPHIDARTMEIHYTKHHQGYLDKLNASLEKLKHQGGDIESLLTHIDVYGDASVRNNAGGYYNHTFFWESMAPSPRYEPAGHLQEAIKREFGSLKGFTNDFAAKALSLFGSGWTWFCVDGTLNFHILNMPNQDNPLMTYRQSGLKPLFGLDVWEHAYYLQYQNRRVDYINAFWQVLDWEVVTTRYEYYRTSDGLLG